MAPISMLADIYNLDVWLISITNVKVKQVVSETFDPEYALALKYQ